jgi:hypothetical protein
MTTFIDRIGKRYGRLTVLSLSHKDKHNHFNWLCHCDCGVERVISGVNIGRSALSCGCRRRENIVAACRLHGHASKDGETSIYNRWLGMRQRCSNPKHISYKWYGARGITVCERWLIFENFLEDMGEVPLGTTLDRINSNGNYEPGNCRWTTPREQRTNQRLRA